jgi:dTDP-glucose 4,6-dehydratase
MKKTILVTGGMGFIGSNFIRYMLQNRSDCLLVNLDKLTYSANPENIGDFSNHPSYRFIQGDILDEGLVSGLCREFGFTQVVHFAAESHVDRSIQGSKDFIQTNIQGTHALLECFREYWKKDLKESGEFRFLFISTDEVYGALGLTGIFTEETPFRPNSPYSASKAGADLLVRAYFETYGFPVLTVRPSNNYGPFQFPEKFIPLMVTNLLEDRPIPIYGRGENVRDWLFVEDTCRAVEQVLEKGLVGQAYNIGGESERRNIEVARGILSALQKGEDYLQFVTDRPGHDLRYALSNSKIRRELGWQPAVDFSTGLARTITWYKDHPEWWKPLKTRLQQESQGFWSRA